MFANFSNKNVSNFAHMGVMCAAFRLFFATFLTFRGHCVRKRKRPRRPKAALPGVAFGRIVLEKRMFRRCVDAFVAHPCAHLIIL